MLGNGNAPRASTESSSANSDREPATTRDPRAFSNPSAPHPARTDAALDTWGPAEAAWADALEALQSRLESKARSRNGANWWIWCLRGWWIEGV